ncbi:MAG: hypothetical protein AABX47_02765 [Nanoarchaeota archaeon]
MAHQDPRVSRLLEQIQRLINGEPITIGGPFDVSNLREQIAQLQTDSALPQEAMSSLVELLSKVDPGLSTWEARKNRQPIKVRAAYRFLKEDYVSWFRIEEEVIDTIGLEVIGVSEILFSNYCGSGPFIARLPDSVTPAQLERLAGLGYGHVKLERNEALALFIDIGIVRRVEKLQQGSRYLDKIIAEFMGREAGNHGDLYFIGPPSDHEEEIKRILSPTGVNVHSSFMGIPVDRGVTNLVGAIPEGATAYRKQTTLFIAPDAQYSRKSR